MSHTARSQGYPQSIARANKQVVSIMTSEPGNVCSGMMAAIRNMVLNDAKRVLVFTFVGQYLAIILFPPPWQERTECNHVMCVFSPLPPEVDEQ